MRSDTVAVNAFNMCNGRADALPNTHGSITATLIFKSSGVVFLAPPTEVPSSTTAISSQSTNSAATTAVSSSRASAFSISQTSSTSSPTPGADKAGVTRTLSKNQVVAIAVSASGGSVVILGLCLLFICARRRRNRFRRRDSDSDTIPFQPDPDVFKTEVFTPFETKKKSGRGTRGTSNESLKGSQPQMDIRREISLRGLRGWKKGSSPPVPPST